MHLCHSSIYTYLFNMNDICHDLERRGWESDSPIFSRSYAKKGSYDRNFVLYRGKLKETYHQANRVLMQWRGLAWQMW